MKKYVYTREERETIIVFNEAEETASIETANPKLKRRLDKLAENFQEIHKDFEREPFAGYTLPKQLISIRQPVKISEEKRAKMALNMERVRGKIGNCD